MAARARETGMARSRRGVGYCQDPECDEYSRGVFLLNHEGGFDCPVCGRTGHVEREQGWKTGDAKLFKEVRVEYAFDAEGRTYREVAIVQDVSLWGRNNIYTLRSPLIRTEKRALKVAEAILANLNRAPDLVLTHGPDPAIHQPDRGLSRPGARSGPGAGDGGGSPGSSGRRG